MPESLCALSADEKWRIDTIVHVRSFRSDDARLQALTATVERIVAAHLESLRDAFWREADPSTEGVWLDACKLLDSLVTPPERVGER